MKQRTLINKLRFHFHDLGELICCVVIPFISAFQKIKRTISNTLEWIRMWWILLPMKGPFDKIPLVWNLAAHFSLTRAGPELDYNVGVFNTIDGLFFQLRRHGVFKAYLGLTPFVTVSTAEGISKVLLDTTNISKSMLYDMLVPWMGGGLLTGSGPAYRKKRKLITPAFHFRVLEDLIPIMEKHGEVFCSKLNDVVDVLPFTQVLGLDIITEAAMGIKLGAQLKPDEPYVRAVYRAAQAHMFRTTRPWLWSDLIFYLTSQGRQFKAAVEEMHCFVTKVLMERMAIIQEDRSKATQSFLDMLIVMHLDQPSELSIIEIRDEVHTFMFAGHDTTATAVAFTLYLVGLHPEILKKIHDELDTVFSDNEDKVTIEKLKHLTYMDATIKESLRLYPSAPVIARRVDKDIEISGYCVPRGATINLFSYGIHRDPKYFPEPLEFRPERFLASQDLPPCAFFPFSAGMRNCIGQKFAMMEMKTVLSKIFRRFNLKSLQKRDELQLAVEVILRPKDGLKIQFSPR